ncbi:hypothetical protein [Corynebacterium tuberculostearicum]|uniref:Uncharacterized protein n=1 Tax=Corynebacterium tuberculostearicum SK141 TaxID=553206 RepID=C6R688_9CORY|nr:hypothetical protein [Corynebacterium tuberculostearicum]EET78470.1 hypothetical protein CORTU0001_2185 [Corynebacterium tuberculostearicum SK141]
MTIINQKTKEAKVIYREVDGIKVETESSNPEYNKFIKELAKTTPDIFPHIVGCKVSATYVAHRVDNLGMVIATDIEYVHPSTANIHIFMVPVEDNRISIIIDRGVDCGSKLDAEMGKSSTHDHAATVTIKTCDSADHPADKTYTSVVREVGHQLSEAVRTSFPITLYTYDRSDSADGRAATLEAAILELENITAELGNRLHKIYGHKLEPKK